MTKFLSLSIVLFLLLFNVSAQVYTVETTPNTKLVNNSYVSNPDGLINSTTVDEINARLQFLEDSTSAQVAVVLLTSIGEDDVFDFAQRLFKRWGIGQASNDNGLLILYIQDQRTIRFHTGFGLEGPLPDVVCKRIQTQYMVPRFKEGDTDAGMLNGVDEVVKILTNPNYVSEIEASDSAGWSSEDWATTLGFIIGSAWLVIGLITFFVKKGNDFSDSKGVDKLALNANMSTWQWLIFCYLLPIGAIALLIKTQNLMLLAGSFYSYILAIKVFRFNRIISRANAWLAKGYYPEVDRFMKKEGNWNFSAILFPIPFVFLNSIFNKKKNGVRKHPRNCSQCGGSMRLLSEKEELKYQDTKMKREEDLKSVDHDVWLCNNCKSTSVWSFINEATRYQKCPSCTALAYRIDSKTIKSATTISEGVEEIRSLCKHCGHNEVTTQPIPKIEISASSSDSSDSSWSDSSSSSDSGGSWGGGDSGGGGASSSW